MGVLPLERTLETGTWVVCAAAGTASAAVRIIAAIGR